MAVRFRLYGTVIGIMAAPFVVVALIAWFTWPLYLSIPQDPHHLDNALIAIAGVGGVLWSGAIITYSIHQKYTPGLRTAVQLIHYTFLAPVIALISEGAVLRTAFTLLGFYYVQSALLSFALFTSRQTSPIEIVSAQPATGETPEEARRRAQERSLRFFDRLEHGRWYFALSALICLSIVITGRQDFVAWSCLAIFVMALFLILPELFELVETKG